MYMHKCTFSSLPFPPDFLRLPPESGNVCIMKQLALSFLIVRIYGYLALLFISSVHLPAKRSDSTKRPLVRRDVCKTDLVMRQRLFHTVVYLEKATCKIN